MTQKKSAIPLKIKEFIKYVKSSGLVKYSDANKEYLFSINEGSKMPLEKLKNIYNHEVTGGDYYDYKDYILASLDDVIDLVFEPKAQQIIPSSFGGLVKLNTYKEFNSTSEPSNDLSLWLEYLERLFPVHKEREVIVKYLAHMFQKPSERPSWHLLFTSDTGTGKGFLFSDILTPLLCKQVSQVSSYSDVTAKHSTCFDSTMLLMLDDPKSKSESTMIQIKSKLSEPYIAVERKYEAASMVKIFTRVILASNEKRPLKLDENERRWFAPEYMKHKVNTGETQLFITKLSEWLNDGGLEAIHEYLLSYSLDGFNHKSVYQTDTLKSMVANSVPILVEELSDWLEDKIVFSWDDLLATFQAPNDLLKKYITELGYKQTRTTIQGKKLRLWHPVSYSTAQVKETFTPTKLF